jgi:hypothetical protein
MSGLTTPPVQHGGDDFPLALPEIGKTEAGL